MKPIRISEVKRIILDVALIFTSSSLALVWSLFLVGLLPVSYVLYYAYQFILGGFTFPNISIVLDTAHVVAYLWGVGELSTQLYTSLELMHMVDVQLLFGLAAFICGASIPYVQTSLRTLRAARVYYVGVLVSLCAVCVIGFDWAFIVFHELLFSNDLWLLDPGSYLLVLFPSTFFVFMAIFVFGLAGVFCVLSRE